MIVESILATPNNKINVAGIAIGDGCLGSAVLCGGQDLTLEPVYWDLVFFYGHGQVSNALHDQILQVCGRDQLMQPTQSDPACQALIAHMYKARVERDGRWRVRRTSRVPRRR